MLNIMASFAEFERELIAARIAESRAQLKANHLRFAGGVRDCVTLLDELRRLEVALVIVTAPDLGDSAQDSFMLNILASFAEFEREIIAARIADSRAQLKERHLRFAGAVPLGYDSDRRTKQLVPNPLEAEIVR